MSMIGKFLAISEERARGLERDQTKVVDFLLSDDIQNSDSLLNVEKAWHAVHFLLTGSAWDGEAPLKNVILGGKPVGDDMGYGPARLLNSDDVKRVSEALTKIEIDKLQAKYNSDLLNEAGIYPLGWDENDLEYIVNDFKKIKDFYENAASMDRCVIQFVV